MTGARVIYRDGPTGRRAGLAGGPDIWEIVRAVTEACGRGAEHREADRIRQLIDRRERPG
jgi:hypothetical protein